MSILYYTVLVTIFMISCTGTNTAPFCVNDNSVTDTQVLYTIIMIQNGDEEPESEDQQRQSRLETEYDHVWGRDHSDRRKNGR